MKMKKLDSKQWMVDMLWGKVAAISWGNPEDQPILLLHGYMDSAATFLPLLKVLPNNYYYVAIDLPGHGRSTAFPDGPLISSVHMVEVIRGFVEHMKWDKFIFIGHSMALLIGTFYNYLYPGKVKRFIHLDPLPPLAFLYLNYFPEEYYKVIYNDYYTNYKSLQEEKSKLIKLDRAVSLISMKRQIDEDQAAAVLSRSIIPVEGGKVRLSWDPKMKKIAVVPILEDTLYDVLASNSPPVLNIVSTEQSMNGDERIFGEKIMRKCQETVANYQVLNVEGGHDAHITNPGKVADYIKTFLDTDFASSAKSKL